MKHGLAATEIVQPCSAVDKGQWKQFVRSRVNEILGATRRIDGDIVLGKSTLQT